MGGVYSNAYLTIGASRASNDPKGFLQPRTFSYSSLNIISRSGQESIKVFLEHLGQNHFDSNDPLALRCWTL
jgi:hypothetical protein